MRRSRWNILNIEILINKETFETIKLDDSNQWGYTWTDLSPKYTWTVEEFVPEGYAVEYAKYGNVVFITNILEDLVKLILILYLEWKDLGGKSYATIIFY